jgi:hypothetical protein
MCVCVCVCLLPGASLDTFSLEICVQCGGCAVDFVKHRFSSASTKSGVPDLCLIPFHWHRKCLHACKCTSRNSCLQLPCQLHISVWELELDLLLLLLLLQCEFSGHLG